MLRSISLLIPLLFLFSGSSPGHAAIGENVRECGARYGHAHKIVRYPMSRSRAEERSYEINGMKITVTFWNGISHREIYVRPREWSDYQIQNAINMNSSTGRLKMLSQSSTRVTWAFGERIFGAYNIRRNGNAFLSVSTAEFARAENMRSRQEWFWRY